MRAIEAERGGNDAGLTTREWAEVLGHSYEWTRQRLSALKRAGRLVVGVRHDLNLAERPHQYVVYRLRRDETVTAPSD